MKGIVGSQDGTCCQGVWGVTVVAVQAAEEVEVMAALAATVAKVVAADAGADLRCRSMHSGTTSGRRWHIPRHWGEAACRDA